MTSKIFEVLEHIEQKTEECFETLEKVNKFCLDITSNFLSKESNKNTQNNTDIENSINFQEIKISKKIGEGGFSEVYQGINQITQKKFAIRLTRINEESFSLSRAKKEMRIIEQLNLIKHKNIIKIYKYDIINENKVYYFRNIMELGVCDFQEILKRRKKKEMFYTESEILKISESLISALKSCLKYGISHRDISLNNIVLGNCFSEAKLIDFSEGVHFIQNLEDMPLVGKYNYMAPEVFNLIENLKTQKKFNIDYNAEKADVFSLGIVILNLCLLTEIKGWIFENVKQALKKIQNNFPKVFHLLEKMLEIIPEKRSKFSELYLLINNHSNIIQNIHLTEIDVIEKSDNLQLFKDDNYEQFIKDAEINQKFKFFKEAINCYLKVYKLLKIGKNNSHQNELIKITVEIGICHKNLTNYEIAFEIFDNLFKQSILLLNNDISLKMRIVYEYANLLIMNSKFEESHKIVSEFINEIKSQKIILPDDKNLFAEIVLLKVKILAFLGYLFDAEIIAKKLSVFFKDENLFNLQILNFSIMLQKCDFNRFIEESQKCLQEIKKLDLFNKKQLKIKINLLKMDYYYKLKDFQNFEKMLVKLKKQFQNFDSIYLVKNSDFLQYVKFKILSLLMKHEYEISLKKVDNIINNLKQPKNRDDHNFFIFSLIKAEIFYKMSDYNKSSDLLQEILKEFDIKKFNEKNLKNYEIFKKIHYQMGCCFYKNFEFKNALKCFKYILVLYYDNEKLFKEKYFDFMLPKIYLMIGKVNFKIDCFENAQKYLEKSEYVLNKIFNNDNYNSNFFRLNINYFKFYQKIGIMNKAKIYIDKAELFVKRMYDKKRDDFFNSVLVDWYQGKFYRNEKNYDKCLNLFKKSCEQSCNIFKNINKSKIVIISIEMIKICVKFKKFDLAKSYLRNCEKMVHKIEKNHVLNFDINFTWGYYEMKKFNFSQAIKYFHNAKKIIVELYKNEICYDAILCDYFIARCFEKKKDFADSISLFEECHHHLLLIFKNYSNLLIEKCRKKLSNLKKNEFPTNYNYVEKENIFF